MARARAGLRASRASRSLAKDRCMLARCHTRRRVGGRRLQQQPLDVGRATAAAGRLEFGSSRWAGEVRRSGAGPLGQKAWCWSHRPAVGAPGRSMLQHVLCGILKLPSFSAQTLTISRVDLITWFPIIRMARKSRPSIPLQSSQGGWAVPPLRPREAGRRGQMRRVSHSWRPDAAFSLL